MYQQATFGRSGFKFAALRASRSDLNERFSATAHLPRHKKAANILNGPEFFQHLRLRIMWPSNVTRLQLLGKQRQNKLMDQRAARRSFMPRA